MEAVIDTIQIIERLKQRFAKDAKFIRKVLNCKERAVYVYTKGGDMMQYADIELDLDDPLMKDILEASANEHDKQFKLFEINTKSNKDAVLERYKAVYKKSQFKRIIKNKLASYGVNNYELAFTGGDHYDCYY